MLRRNVLALNENMHDRDLTVPVPAGHNKVLFISDGLQCLQSCAPIGKQAKQVGAREKSTSLAYTTSTRFSFNCRAQSWRLRRNRLLNSGCCSLINRASRSRAPISPAVHIQLIRRDCRSMAASSGVRKMRKHPTADINAFADIERHGVTFAMKQIHPWSGG